MLLYGTQYYGTQFGYGIVKNTFNASPERFKVHHCNIWSCRPAGLKGAG
jgi:hypothetical protein